MKSKFLSFILYSILFTPMLSAQDWADKKEAKKTPTFVFGVNVGTLFANNNTASIYDGSEKNSSYGVQYILDLPQNTTFFDTYFNQSHSLEELPLNPTYKTALDIGIHAGINISRNSSIFVEINMANLSVEQLFTILIDDPTNLAIEPNYEQLPIIGEEKRININLGTQLSFFNKGKTNLYWSFFGNFNNIQLERNYIVIDGKEFEIRHTLPQQPNTKPNGIGYGGGTGVGVKYKLSETLTTDLAYNFYYIKTSINDNLQGFGINHGVTLRLLWNQ
tara:strand:- start:4818 stop:5645 length:828 start_codon:yes stop_codon:yes gene_type:complete